MAQAEAGELTSSPETIYPSATTTTGLAFAPPDSIADFPATY
jgi:hypothetical protein